MIKLRLRRDEAGPSVIAAETSCPTTRLVLVRSSKHRSGSLAAVARSAGIGHTGSHEALGPDTRAGMDAGLTPRRGHEPAARQIRYTSVWVSPRHDDRWIPCTRSPGFQ